MVSLNQVESNKRNSELFTGPNTRDGKVVARMNSVAHGMLSQSPVVPGENPEQWETFQQEMIADLAPVGMMEVELADRVAILSWRLRRVTKYESAMVASAGDEETETSFLPMNGPEPRTCKTIGENLKDAEQTHVDFIKLADLLGKLIDADDQQPFSGSEALSILDMFELMRGQCDNREIEAILTRISDAGIDANPQEFLKAIGVPETEFADPEFWQGWTAAHIRAGMRQIARVVKMTLEQILVKSKEFIQEILAVNQEYTLKITKELAELRLADAKKEALSRQRKMVPECYEKVMRYEAHLSRQLTQALHQLERLQALRSDNPPIPPIAVDVLIQSEGERGASARTSAP